MIHAIILSVIGGIAGAAAVDAWRPRYRVSALAWWLKFNNAIN